MMGFDAPYVPGYDCHGLPIETHVEKKLAEKGKNKNDLPVATFRRICREHAATAMNGQTRDFSRLGILGEWETPYLTMSHEYESETARLFGKFLERGYVYKGLRPVYWCIHDQTALAEAEVEYKLHTSPSVYVKFPLVTDAAEIDEALAGKKVSLVIWTTTPWTIPANLGIAVHPDFEYAAVEARRRSFNRRFGTGRFCHRQMRLRRHERRRRAPDSADSGEISKARNSKGMKARHPWLERESLMMNGEHVTLGGEADAETELDVADARKRRKRRKPERAWFTPRPDTVTTTLSSASEYGLEIYCPVDNAGRFTAEVEHFAGENIFKANPKIVELMRENGSLLFSENYEHRYPHCWRCKNPVIFRATPQWFISMDETAKSGAENPCARKRCARNRTGQMASGVGRRSNGEYDQRSSRLVRFAPAFVGRADSGFLLQACDEAIADPKIINHVADIFAKETADAWYNATGKRAFARRLHLPEMQQRGFSQGNRYSGRLVRFRFVVRRGSGNARRHSAFSGGRLSRRRRPVSRLV